MARPPGSTVVVAVLVAVGTAVLVAFLITQGLDRANLWAGVLALFLTIVAVAAQILSIRRSPGRPALDVGTPTATGAPGRAADGTDGPAGDGDRPADVPARAPDGRPPGRVGRFPGLPAVGRRPYPALVVGVVAAALIVLVVVNLRRETGPPEVDATSSGPTASGPTAPAGWVQVRSGVRLTLADGQSFDLDRGVTGGENAPGGDLLLSQRADRLGVSEPGELAVVVPGDGHPVQRCLATDNWDGTIDGMHELTAGTDICVRTADHLCAMLSIESPPDVLVRLLAFRYTLWERR